MLAIFRVSFVIAIVVCIHYELVCTWMVYNCITTHSHICTYTMSYIAQWFSHMSDLCGVRFGLKCCWFSLGGGDSFATLSWGLALCMLMTNTQVLHYIVGCYLFSQLSLLDEPAYCTGMILSLAILSWLILFISFFVITRKVMLKRSNFCRNRAFCCQKASDRSNQEAWFIDFVLQYSQNFYSCMRND